ncbi:hypothetical protein [Halobacterium rubrum]|uniref:hypothetical protein n=1 Tax=Halobacterium TaxID=2239 RepID=UPI001F3589B3|nr:MULTISPECIES: hypothetical protein [Halobacterium]MDH5021723.1 hypothetical protein [Halobacterium rubrum]
MGKSIKQARMNAHTTNTERVRRAGDILWLPTALSLWFVQPKLASAGVEAVGLAIHAIAACFIVVSAVMDLRDLLE